MTTRKARSTAIAADSIASAVHANVHGKGDSADLAAAIHTLCQAVTELADEVDQLDG